VSPLRAGLGLMILVLCGACAERPPPDPEPVPQAFQSLAAPAELSLEAAPGHYKTLCAPCHGDAGAGDGPASVGLDPKPADFTELDFMWGRSERFLYWRVSEGKSLTPMPAFKYTLSDEERWALVRWMRAEFSRRAG